MTNSHSASGLPPEAGPANSPEQPEGASSEPAARSDSPGSPRKVIKRYSNRKLYDTATSKYVTLDDIAQMVKAGEDVRIIDNESKDDLTSVTLTQIIYEEEKAARRVPLGMLRGIIQSGGETLNEFFDRSSKSVETSVSELRQGAMSIGGALADTARRYLSPEARRAEEFRRAVWMAIDGLEERLSERIQQVEAAREHLAAQGGSESLNERVEQHTHAVEHVAGLRTRVAALSVLIDRLERVAREPEPAEDI